MAEPKAGFKKVTIGNTTYTVPESWNPQIAQQQLELEKDIGESIDLSIKTAELAPRELEKAQGASLLDLRRDAARNIQSARGLSRSGRGLGIARDVSESTNIKSGVLRGDFATDINKARQDAAAAKTAGLTAKGELLEAQATRKAAGSRAKLRAQEIQKKYAGDIYTTNADRRRMITELEAERDAAIDPMAVVEYQMAIDRVKGGTTKDSGTIDLPF